MRLYFGGLLFVLIAFSTMSVGEPADSISSGAPTAADGRFINSAGDIGHGSLAVRLPFMLRRFGTYSEMAGGNLTELPTMAYS